jgi:hypothetical protein
VPSAPRIDRVSDGPLQQCQTRSDHAPLSRLIGCAFFVGQCQHPRPPCVEPNQHHRLYHKGGSREPKRTDNGESRRCTGKALVSWPIEICAYPNPARWFIMDTARMDLSMTDAEEAGWWWGVHVEKPRGARRRVRPQAASDPDSPIDGSDASNKGRASMYLNPRLLR